MHPIRFSSSSIRGAATPVIEMENTFENDATSFFVSKRKLTGDEELPGATLTIQDKDGNVVRQWVSGDTPTEIRGLKFDTVYTLVETAAPNGYELAESMRFKLIQRKDENGDLLNEADVYVCTGKDWLIFDHWTLLEDGMVVMRDAPQPRYPGKSVFDSHSDTGAAGKYAYAYTNACYQPSGREIFRGFQQYCWEQR